MEARKDEKRYGKTILDARFYATGKGIARVQQPIADGEQDDAGINI